jgi:two-component system LytT family response regulator
MALKELANLRAPSAEEPTDASPKSPEGAIPSPEEVQVLRDGGKVRIVRSGEIHSVRAEGNYTRLQLAGGGTLMVRRPIAVWEASLPSEIFLKISKSLLVNRNSIRGFDRISRDVTHLRLADSTDPILLSRIESQRLSKALAKRMNKEWRRGGVCLGGQ